MPASRRRSSSASSTPLLGVDAFNLLNEDYVLQRDRRTDLGGAHVVRERLSPRVFRLGVTLRFR